ncbi:MAG: DHH family phosphoesterase [Methanobacteriota archaeon]
MNKEPLHTIFASLQGKGLIIHHWDTDGICSARLLLENLQEKTIVNHTPILGNYFLTDTELQEYAAYDFIIIADMAIPKEQILLLAKNARVIIFDHHLQEEITEVYHHNPIIKGGDPNRYPSASWIINQFLKNPINLYALLGVIGDHEQKIKNNTMISQYIQGFCHVHILTFNDLLHMVYMIDSNYKLGERTTVEDAPRFLLTHNTPKDILTHPDWNNNLARLEQEITSQLASPGEEKNNIIIKTINTSYNIISTITRKLAWDHNKDAVVVNTGFFSDRDQIYVRSKKNMEPLIIIGKNQGFKAGGKKEVLGAIVPKEKTESFLQEILVFLTS